MNKTIKGKLPASKAMLEKKSEEIVSEIKKDVTVGLKKELQKELQKVKDTNIRMNSNTNVHIEDIKKQLANSIDTKMEYTKLQFEDTQNKLQNFSDVIKRMSPGISKLNEIYEMEKNVNKQMAIWEKEVNRRLERLEKLLEMNRYGITKEKRKTQLIVSFTSYGKRITTVPLVLDRLFNQTLKPDRIVLYLSKDNFPGMESELPERLLDMRQYGMDIHWCDGDIKSYKKIIPALKEFPNDIIITIDDDIYYDLDFIEKLYDSYKKHPNAISALRVHKMKFNEQGGLLSYNEWDSKHSDILDEESMQLFATGAGGILYPPQALSTEVLNESMFMELCPNADDVWLKFMAVLNNTPVVLAAKYPGVDYYVDGTQEESLWKHNVKENDIQIKKLIEKYNSFSEGETLLNRINR